MAPWVGLDEEAVAPAATSSVGRAFWGLHSLSHCSPLSSTALC